MIADMEANKKLSPTVTEIFLRGREPNISTVFISHFYFKVPKTIKTKHNTLFIMKLPNKRKLLEKASNNLSDI